MVSRNLVVAVVGVALVACGSGTTASETSGSSLEEEARSEDGDDAAEMEAARDEDSADIAAESETSSPDGDLMGEEVDSQQTSSRAEQAVSSEQAMTPPSDDTPDMSSDDMDDLQDGQVAVAVEQLEVPAPPAEGEDEEATPPDPDVTPEPAPPPVSSVDVEMMYESDGYDQMIDWIPARDSSMGTVQIELQLDGDFCDLGDTCEPQRHIAIFDSGGTTVLRPATEPSCGRVMCDECQVTNCAGFACLEPAPTGLQDEVMVWDGLFYQSEASCVADGVSVGCTQRTYAESGTYVAQMCAIAGTQDDCQPTREVCTFVTFNYPSDEPVVGVLSAE